MVIETFKKLLRMEQSTVKLAVSKYLIRKGYEPEYKDGYVYAKGDIPVLLVAHMDTVHNPKPINIYYDQEEGIMWSPEGIGGDDRCGIYTIMEILKTHKPHVLFTEDEEIGAVGALKAVTTLEMPDINFIIELDRRGINDCVFYDCDNKEFQDYISSFGFNKAYGAFSDIVELSEAWDVASVNLSIGYMREHTKSEVIYTDIMELTKRKVISILDDANKNTNFYEYDRIIRYYPQKDKLEDDIEEISEYDYEEEFEKY